jgi:hypothetical protein
MNNTTIAYYDSIAKDWYCGWLKGFTQESHAIIEKVNGGVIVIPDWQLRSLSNSLESNSTQENI